MFRGLVILELVLDWLKVVDGLFFSVELGRDLLLEDGGEHPAQNSKLIISNLNELLEICRIIDV